MRTRTLTVSFPDHKATALFSPMVTSLNPNPWRRNNFKANFWVCHHADQPLNFLNGFTAHAAHIALALRGLKWKWLCA